MSPCSSDACGTGKTVGNDGDGIIINLTAWPNRPPTGREYMGIAFFEHQCLDPYHMGRDRRSIESRSEERDEIYKALTGMVITPQDMQASGNILRAELTRRQESHENLSDLAIFSDAVWRLLHKSLPDTARFMLSTYDKFDYNHAHPGPLSDLSGPTWSPFSDHGDGLIINLCPINGEEIPDDGTGDLEYVIQILDPYRSATKEDIESARASIKQIVKSLPRRMTSAAIRWGETAYAEHYGHSIPCCAITPYVGLVYATREDTEARLTHAGKATMNYLVSTPRQFRAHSSDNVDDYVIVHRTGTEVQDSCFPKTAISSLGSDWDSATDYQMATQLHLFSTLTLPLGG